MPLSFRGQEVMIRKYRGNLHSIGYKVKTIHCGLMTHCGHLGNDPIMGIFNL